MPICRELLDWKRPALATAADYLLTRFRQESEFDLSSVIVVVPGARAGRRLLELLVNLAEEQSLTLTPPEIVTESNLPERLYQPQLEFADPLVQQLAWVQALQSLPPAKTATFLPHPPPPSDLPRWLAIGKTLAELHKELAADGLDCESVLKGGDGMQGFAEHDRWRALCEIQQAYLRTLDGLQLWDVQTARLVAIKQREIHTDKQVILLGMVDLNRAQRQMLDQIADRVTALVVAPPALADRFDEHGCLIPDQWTTAELPLADEQIERVDGPADQADAASRWLASLGGKYRADQIAIGVPDQKLAPQIERELAQCGVASRQAIGKQLAETGPYRLLKVAADYATRRRFRDLAALVRHPDVFDWLVAHDRETTRSHDLLTALDTYACAHFPARIDLERLSADEEAAAVRTACQKVEKLIAPLVAANRSEEEQPLAAWAEKLREILVTVYGDRQLDRNQPADRYLLEALSQTRDVLDELAHVPPELQPRVDARQATRLVLDVLARGSIAPPAEPNAVELLGWLELPLDDAPALAVTTFNEGFVPSSACADAFLPNGLRCRLGLLDNDRRLARDAYALSVLLASRKELRLIVARRDAEGNPLVASRLLFATDPERVVARARRFFGELEAAPPRRRLLGTADPPRPKSVFVPPPPQPLPEPITAISVTRLRDYIACPYRFYLRHVVKAKEVSDEAAELDGSSFGNLVHDVLEQFGRSSEAAAARSAIEPKPIVEYLEYQLDRVASARYGKHARPAVRVQIEQARLRLTAFAAWQAERTVAGWRIVFSEDSERTLLMPLDVDGTEFTLRGRIDRVDYHESLRRLAVLDYKTADAGEKPDRTHLRSGEWIDLQLPLYRRLVWQATLPADVPRDAAIELGYILLPKDSGTVGLALAKWDAELLNSADERAREILRAILAQHFWPPTAPPPEFFDDLAAICLDHALGSWQSNQGGAT